MSDKLIDSLCGEWVRNQDMPSTTNIWGRRFWADGVESEYYGQPLPIANQLYWYFTPEQCGRAAEGDAP